MRSQPDSRAGRRGAAGRLLAGLLAGALAVAACAAEPQRGSTRPGTQVTSPGQADGLGLSVGEGGRHFVDEAGDPFFWLGDTAWSIANTLDRDEVELYLDTRAEQGYTVIQAVALFPQAGGEDPNRYGDRPYRGGLDGLVVTDGADPGDDEQYDFWDHLDFVIAQAEERGLRVALLPVWADDQVGELVTQDNAAAYGEFLGARYSDDELIWVMGGDRSADGVEDVWRELARGVAIGATGAEDYSTTTMTYHPVGDKSSASWFHDNAWLDFNMIQGGHCLRFQVRQEIVDSTYGERPPKPFLDGEPIYEDHPYCWDGPPEGYSTPQDVRADAYWAVFGGAAGHTYGHHAVWQFLGDGRPPVLGARGDWRAALEDEAAGQMRHLRALMESRPFATGVPDQDLITSDGGAGQERLQATRAEDGAYLMVYSPTGASFDVDLSVLAGAPRSWWFDPRTGEATDAGPSAGRFTPPSQDDWVLVADDASRGFDRPGARKP